MADRDARGAAGTTGALFVFEGPDNVGKSTLAVEVEQTLVRRSGRRVARFAFPGRSPGTLGAHIYDVHHDPARFDIRHITPIALQTLHIAAHLDAIESEIRPLLQQGTVVLLDRYWWSTWVFGIALGADRQALEALVRLEQTYWGSMEPLAVFLIDRAAATVSSHETSTLDKIRQEYTALAAREASRVPVIQVRNDGPPATTTEAIVRMMLELAEVSAATLKP